MVQLLSVGRTLTARGAMTKDVWVRVVQASRHRGDRCGQTPPAHAPAFANWSGGKAKIAWMSMSGMPDRNPCGPFGAHGFYFNDAEPVSAIIRFLKAQ